MKSKCITRHPDYNCRGLERTDSGDYETVYLIGGKWDNTEPQRVKLPFRVEVGWGSDITRRWLNQNCESWYDWDGRGDMCWFERDRDAILVLMVFG